MAKTNPRSAARTRRKVRVRKSVVGTPERPRLAVYRSNRHISVQVIDDSQGVTLAAASTYEPELRGAVNSGVASASAVGSKIGERAKAAGISSVVFDRGGNRYHGRIAAVAEAAREAGLEF